jgi:carbon storage regulator
MLILTRRVGESVVIDGGITVTVSKINGDRVKLGFEAPEGIRIDRKEIWLKIQAEQQQGVQS